MGTYEATTTDKKCIFCQIVAGAIPAASFWENENFLAFLSIDPNTEGFSCVIPKKHFGSDVLKMPDAELQQFILAAKEAAQALEGYYSDVGRVGLIMEGTGIDHAHIKLVPMHGTEHMKRGEWKQYLSHQEQWFDAYEGWISSAGGPNANPEKLQELARRLREAGNLSFRKPQPDELPAIRMILEQWTEKEEAEKYIERIGRGLEGPLEHGMDFWVAKEGDTVIGVGGLADPLPSVVSRARSDKPGELKILYLDDASRGQGKGRKFLAFLENAARESGRRELLVRSALRYRETAFDFYKRAGYEDLGEITNDSGQPMQLFRKALL